MRLFVHKSVDSFAVVPVMLVVVPIFMVVAIGYAAVKGIAEWSSNNAQPVLTVSARVVAKRSDVSTRHSSLHNDDSMHFHNHTNTSYYVTFDLASGERREVKVDGNEYGMIAEGDQGYFSYQGTRYQGFVRTT